MPLTQSQSRKVAPHPVLSEYYADEQARRTKVDQMFDASAKHYDWICGLMSFGSGRMHRRNCLVRGASVGTGMKILDVGAGTGVISHIAQELVGPEGLVIALDPSRGMQRD